MCSIMSQSDSDMQFVTDTTSNVRFCFVVYADSAFRVNVWPYKAKVFYYQPIVSILGKEWRVGYALTIKSCNRHGVVGGRTSLSTTLGSWKEEGRCQGSA